MLIIALIIAYVAIASPLIASWLRVGEAEALRNMDMDIDMDIDKEVRTMRISQAEIEAAFERERSNK